MFSREEVWCFVTCTVALLLSVLRLRQDDEVALMLLVPMHCSHRVTLSVAGVPGDCLWSAGEHQGLASRADFSPHPGLTESTWPFSSSFSKLVLTWTKI